MGSIADAHVKRKLASKISAFPSAAPEEKPKLSEHPSTDVCEVPRAWAGGCGPKPGFDSLQLRNNSAPLVGRIPRLGPQRRIRRLAFRAIRLTTEDPVPGILASLIGAQPIARLLTPAEHSCWRATKSLRRPALRTLSMTAENHLMVVHALCVRTLPVRCLL